MKFIVSKTYEIVTEESSRNGEVAERGFEYEKRELDFRELVGEIADGSFVREPGTHWLTSEPQQDFRSGDWTVCCLHLQSGTNDSRAWRYFYLAEKIANKRT